MAKHCKNARDCFEQELQRCRKRLRDYQAIPTEAGADLVGSARLAAHQLLGTYFGNEAELTSAGLIGGLTYRIDSSNPLSDGVLFFYDVVSLASDDDPEPSVERRPTLEARLPELFFKGRRWSSLQWSEIFYEGFAPISRAATKTAGHLRTLTPIRWFAEHDASHRSIRIAPKVNLDLSGLIAQVPCALDQAELKEIPLLRDLPPLLVQALFQFRIASHAHRAGHPSYSDTDLMQAFRDWDRVLAKSAFSVPGLSAGCSTPVLARLLYLFQFYDVPYGLDVFSSRGDSDSQKWYSALALSRELDEGKFSGLPSQDVAELEALVTALGDLARFDAEVRRRVSEDHHHVERVVEQLDGLHPQFHALGDAVESILRAKGIARGSQRGVVRIAWRVKESVGALTKSLRRRPLQSGSRPPRRILDPIAQARTIAGSIPDLLGLRISSAFEAYIPEVLSSVLDVPQLRDGIKHVKLMNELANPEQARRVLAVLKDAGIAYVGEKAGSYRGIHLQLDLPKSAVQALVQSVRHADENKFRLDLYRIEIQLRSSMIDGWADVSHRLSYKAELRDFVGEFGTGDILTAAERAAMDIGDAERRLESARLAYSRLQRRFGDGR